MHTNFNTYKKKRIGDKNMNKNETNFINTIMDAIFDDCPTPSSTRVPIIQDVKFYNDIATVVTFVDGTRSRCVCASTDTFSKEVGIAICLAKRAIGNRNFHEEITKYCEQPMTYNEKKKKKKKPATCDDHFSEPCHCSYERIKNQADEMYPQSDYTKEKKKKKKKSKKKGK